MLCATCDSPARKNGKNRNGTQRYRCDSCRHSWSDESAKPLGSMRLPMEKAAQCLKLLLEGCSVRSTERLTGVHRDTILSLMVLAGEKCKDLLESKIVNMPVQDVEVDELWAFVKCKEKTRLRDFALSDSCGDVWCYYAFEANTKFILSWHVGKRSSIDTECFVEKMRETVADGFQLTTDGYKPYPQAIGSVFGSTVNYAVLHKNYGTVTTDDFRRYSPAQIVSIDKKAYIGRPDKDRVCTSYIERNNLNVRMQIRRMTRLTNAFSKKWENHEAAMALYFGDYNFCRKHGTLKMTPAQAAGITDHQWTVEELLSAK